MTAMTPDQRAAYEEAMAREAHDSDADGWLWDQLDEALRVVYRRRMGAALNALLALRFPCPDCGGDGWDHDCGIPYIRCKPCGGSGEVDSPRIALVEKARTVIPAHYDGVRDVEVPAERLWRVAEPVVPDQEDAKP
jgi:hypothetical protein